MEADKRVPVSELAARPWTLVGRTEEAQHIAEILSRPEGGHVVLAGAAGVGKTRLARDVGESLPAGGRELRWSTATRSARAVPLGALLPLLPDAAAGRQTGWTSSAKWSTGGSRRR